MRTTPTNPAPRRPRSRAGSRTSLHVERVQQPVVLDQPRIPKYGEERRDRRDAGDGGEGHRDGNDLRPNHPPPLRGVTSARARVSASWAHAMAAGAENGAPASEGTPARTRAPRRRRTQPGPRVAPGVLRARTSVPRPLTACPPRLAYRKPGGHLRAKPAQNSPNGVLPCLQRLFEYAPPVPPCDDIAAGMLPVPAYRVSAWSMPSISLCAASRNQSSSS